MSGRQEDADGILWLRSHLRNHVDGKLVCPSAVQHCLRLDNVSVCDINVSFVAAPEDGLLRYGCGPAWRAEVVLPGSSKPRRRRHDSFEQPIQVAPLPLELIAPQRRDLEVTTVVRAISPYGVPEGPDENSARLRHRLTLG